MQKLIAANDYKVDQGHEFGSQLADEEKKSADQVPANFLGALLLCSKFKPMSVDTGIETGNG